MAIRGAVMSSISIATKIVRITGHLLNLANSGLMIGGNMVTYILAAKNKNISSIVESLNFGFAGLLVYGIFSIKVIKNSLKHSALEKNLGKWVSRYYKLEYH